MAGLTQILERQVDLSGLLEVLGKNLYSTPTVALRELVQNAHDSIVRRRLEAQAPAEEAIAVFADPGAGKLIIEDSGAGLTREEIERDLATVGTGYTRRLRQEHADAELIGQFGLGFLTAFIISERVDLVTTSASAPDEGWRFSSTGGERYTVSPAPARAVGTRVELQLAPAFRELADADIVHRVLQSYCALLRVPVFSDPGRTRRVNDLAPPWRGEAPDSPLRARKRQLEFAGRFEPSFEPLCTFSLGGDGKDDPAGLVWIQDGGSYASSDNRNASVFVRGMLVSRKAYELIPRWAGFAGAVIELDRLEPTASREDLRRDETYAALEARVREVLIEGLSAISREQPAVWRRVLARHNEALLGASLADPRLFEILADELRVPTSEGDLPLSVVRSRSGGKLHVSLSERSTAEQTLFRALKVPVVQGFRFAALPFAERWAEDRGVALVKLGTEAGNEALFSPARLEPEVERRMKDSLLEPGWALMPSRFAPEALPAVLIPDREVELKARMESDEADRRIGAALLGLARQWSAGVDDTIRARLYLNLDNRAVQRLIEGEGPKVEAGARLVKALAQLMAQEPNVDSGVAEGLAGASAALRVLLGEEGDE